MDALMETSVPGFAKRSGKVRDVYDIGDKLVIITTDRHSAFDVNMAQGIPGKGVVLAKLSGEVWPRVLGDALGSFHLISTNLRDMPEAFGKPEFKGRTALCRKAKVIPIEGIVRGYLEGTAWKEYQEHDGVVCGIQLPPGLQRCSQLPEPIFTPSTKAETGHDENITFDQMCKMVGVIVSRIIQGWSIALYQKAHKYARGHGVIVADTKFEFGRIEDHIVLIDEILTPDSSRFWPVADYQPGRAQKSMDKQPLRDYLQALCDKGEWNKQAPPPYLPGWLIYDSQNLYHKIYRLLNNGNGLQ